MASARVVTWPGGVTEVQLPPRREVDKTDAADTAALVRAAMEQAEAARRCNQLAGGGCDDSICGGGGGCISSSILGAP